MKFVKAIAILAFIIFFSAGLYKGGYEVGDKVEDFQLKNVRGEMISMANFKSAKGFIVIFDCNTCPFSQAYLERIKALHAMYSDQGYPVIAINSNDPNRSPGDTFEKMISYADDNNYRHNYVYDHDQTVATAFGATNTPQVFLLQKQEDDYVLVYTGAIDNNTKDASAADKKYVEDAMTSILKGENPAMTKTKAIGCTIKWSDS